MDGEPLDLTAKLGPLPYWEWAVGAIAVYFVYSHFLHPKVTVATAPNPTDAVVDDGSGDVTGDILGGSGSGSSGSTDYSGDTSGLSGLAAPTNLSWLHNAIDGLLGSQYNSADINDALTNWMAGNPITADQRAIVAAAIEKFGAPPTPIPTNNGTGENDGSASGGVPAVGPGGGIPGVEAGTADTTPGLVIGANPQSIPADLPPAPAAPSPFGLAKRNLNATPPTPGPYAAPGVGTGNRQK